jgi:glycosyltransferase involved in cell wall biosynthesis
VRVLVVSQYFSPEVGATQNRMDSFVDALLEAGHRVTVVCEQPNHPQGVYRPGYGRRPVVTERPSSSLTIHRLLVAASPKRSAARRMAFYGTFALGALLRCATLARHDVLFTSSPPLPGPVAAAWAARLRRTPYVLDVRDLWPAAASALGELTNERAIALLTRLEHSLYRHAAAVTATTRPFCDHVAAIRSDGEAIHVPNGALDAFVARDWPPRPAGGELVVGYFGNLGIAQGLDVVLDAAPQLAGTARFLLMGDGPRSAELRRVVAERRLENVELAGQVPLDEVGAHMARCDALLVPLAADPIFAQFVPSKLYDSMAVGRTVLLATVGESVRILEAAGAGIAVPPGDGQALAAAIHRLAVEPGLADRLGAAGRAAAAPYARSIQARNLVEVLCAAAGRAA